VYIHIHSTLYRHKLAYKNTQTAQFIHKNSMTEAEHARLAEIQQEYGAMGLTSQWVRDYTRLSAFYPDPATDMPSHDGKFIMLPPGTIPHEIYTEKLTNLTESMEKAEEHVRAIKRRKQSGEDDEYSKEEYIRSFGQGAYNQHVIRQAEIHKKKLTQPKEIQNELRLYLTESKPINARKFHNKIDNLIKEEIRILTNIRIHEASMDAYVSPI
jgi:hypothetical protein